MIFDFSKSNLRIPPLRANHLGPIIGSVLGAIVAAFLALLLCKLSRRRRSIQDQEHGLSATWVPRPFSRAARHSYADIDMPSEIQPAYQHAQSNQDYTREKVNETGTVRPPVSFSKFTTPSRMSRPKRSRKLVSVGGISGPVGPVTMEGESTALHSALQSGTTNLEIRDLLSGPAKAPSARSSMSTVKELPERFSVAEEITIEDRDNQPSRGSSTTNGSITFARPTSAASSTIMKDYLSAGRSVTDPFTDPTASPGTSPESTLLGHRRFSASSTAQSHSQFSIRTYNPLPPDGTSHSVRGPNFTALLSGAR